MTCDFCKLHENKPKSPNKLFKHILPTCKPSSKAALRAGMHLGPSDGVAILKVSWARRNNWEELCMCLWAQSNTDCNLWTSSGWDKPNRNMFKLHQRYQYLDQDYQNDVETRMKKGENNVALILTMKLRSKFKSQV